MKNSQKLGEVSDETLIGRIANADETALGEFYDRYHRLIFGIVLNAIGDKEAAKEITQDVFLSVWKKAQTYRVERGKASTWLTRMARNRAIDVFRRESVRHKLVTAAWADNNPGVMVSDETPEAIASLENQKQRIRSAVASLPDTQKDAIALAYFQGYSQSHIAKLLDQPLGTVKARIRTGMKKLRDLLESEEMFDTSKSA